MQAGERVALGANEELKVVRHYGGIRNVDGGDDGALDSVVARIADDADDLAPCSISSVPCGSSTGFVKRPLLSGKGE
jgi:hypothetical protein